MLPQSHGFVDIDSSLVRWEPTETLPTNLSAPLKRSFTSTYNDNVCVICVNDNSFDIFVLNNVYGMLYCMTIVSASCCVCMLPAVTSRVYNLRFIIEAIAKIQSSQTEGRHKLLLIAPCFTQEVENIGLVVR